MLAGGWWLLAAGCWRLAASCWLLAACLNLAVGCFQLRAGCLFVGGRPLFEGARLMFVGGRPLFLGARLMFCSLLADYCFLILFCVQFMLRITIQCLHFRFKLVVNNELNTAPVCSGLRIFEVIFEQQCHFMVCFAQTGHPRAFRAEISCFRISLNPVLIMAGAHPPSIPSILIN